MTDTDHVIAPLAVLPPLEPHPLTDSPDAQHLAVSHAPAESGPCTGCQAEYEELCRDKRDVLDLACPLWLPAPTDDCIVAFLTSIPADAPAHLLRLADTMLNQAGSTEPSCQCVHLLAAGTPHTSQDGTPWCAAHQQACAEPHPVASLHEYTFRRSGGHTPVCAHDDDDRELRCLCETPDAPHFCPDHAPEPEAKPEPHEHAEPEGESA